MRHGFGINFKRREFVSVNMEKMELTIESGNCILNFRDKQYIIESGERSTINEKIDVIFNKQPGGARGRITFFCDDSIKIFRSNHPKMQMHNAELSRADKTRTV